MAARIINGSDLARRIREDTKARVEQLRAKGLQLRLDTLIVGDPEAGLIFARSQEARCRKMGIDYKLHTLDKTATDTHVQEYIHQLSVDPDVTGILLNLPMPEHLDTPAAQYAIDPYKDVEGVNPANIGLMFYGTPIIAPCTALAVMAVLKEAGVTLKGKNAVVVGQGNIVGKPTALALMGEKATVTTCNKYTPNLAMHTSQADILIAAAGVAGLIKAEHVKPGSVVIDVGINSVPDPTGEPGAMKVVGDVCFDEVSERASVITPVPGGVGPVTVAILLFNTAEAAAKQISHRRIHPT